METLIEAPDRRAWLFVGLLSTIHLLAFVDRFAMSAVAVALKTAFKLNETQLGALQGLAIGLPYALAILPFGWLADRYSPRRLTIFGLLIWTAGAFGCAFSTTSVQLWAARALIGVGQAAFVPAALIMLGRLFPLSVLARPLSVFTAGSTLGKSVALLAAGAILSLDAAYPSLARVFHAPWRAVFALSALPNLILILVFLTLAPHPRAEPVRTDAGAPLKTADGGAILSPAFLSFALVALAPVVLIQATAAWTPTFYVRTFHLSPARAAYLLGTAVLFAAPIGHLLGGQLTTLGVRRGFNPGWLVAGCLTLAAPLGAAFCFAPSLGVSIACYCALVLLLGMAGPAGLVGVSFLAPPDRRAGANALYMGAVTLIGVGLGPTLIGMMSDAWFGGASGLGLSLATLLVGVPALCVTLTLAASQLWRWSQIEGPGAFAQMKR